MYREKSYNRRPCQERHRAFTLIELLLVLVILGVLAAIVVPRFSGRSEQAKVTAAKTDISRIEAALDMFEIDNGRYPTSAEGLQALYERPSNLENWKQYIKRGIPRDPWSNDYVYEYPGRYNENGFDLSSMGADQRQGTEDDVTNWNIDER